MRSMPAPGGRSGCTSGNLPADIRPCCGRVNRGLAILGDKVFLGTLDAHVIALDAKTGNVIWDVVAADYRTGHSFTVAPLAVKNLIIIGVSGGEYGVRGFIDAYDADTGKRKWRFYTVPGPGEPGHESLGGRFLESRRRSRVEHGHLRSGDQSDFLADGKSRALESRRGRAGDNLYSNSLLALNADTGKMNWYFQFTKHDEHDWDATQVPVMIDAGGKHLIAQANRNGFFYVIDRTTGKLISANAYGKTTWSDSQRRRGPPGCQQEASPTLEGHTVCPGALGTTNFMAPTYDPQTALFYVTARDQCDIFSTAPQPYEARPRLLRQRVFPFRRGRALSRISQGDRSRDRRDEVEVRAHFADVVGRALDWRWPGLQRRRRRKLHRLRRRIAQAAMAFPDGRRSLCCADGLRRRRKRICRDRRGKRDLRVWFALNQKLATHRNHPST